MILQIRKEDDRMLSRKYIEIEPTEFESDCVYYRLPKKVKKPTEKYLKSLRPKDKTKYWIGNINNELDYWLENGASLIELE